MIKDLINDLYWDELEKHLDELLNALDSKEFSFAVRQGAESQSQFIIDETVRRLIALKVFTGFNIDNLKTDNDHLLNHVTMSSGESFCTKTNRKINPVRISKGILLDLMLSDIEYIKKSLIFRLEYIHIQKDYKKDLPQLKLENNLNAIFIYMKDYHDRMLSR